MPDDTVRVLMIEDEADYARLVSTVLATSKSRAYEVEYAGTLAEGLQRLAEAGIDVVLLDLKLPDSGKVNTVACVHEKSPQTPIVVLSGWDDDETIFQSLQQGAQEYLVKGKWSDELLFRSIRYAIERKRAEESARLSEKKYRGLADSLPQVVFEMDCEGNLTFVNRYAFEAFGYSEEDFEKGLHALAMLHEEDRKRAAGNIQSVLDGNPTSGVEYTALRKDGSTFPVAIYSDPISENGESSGLRGIMVDISERKRAEQVLHESEARYRQLFENMSSAVAVYEAVDDGADFVFREFNRAAELAERLKREDVIGRRVTEVFPEVETFGLLGVLREVWRTGEAQYVPPARYQDERISGWRENHLYRLPSSEVVAIYDDVTERQLTTQRVKTTMDGAIQAIALTAEMRDPYTAGHQQRVSELAVAIAREMGLREDVIEGIRIAGLLHDVGKMSIPAEILAKPTKLTDAEMTLVRNHSRVSSEILKGIDFPWPLDRMVLQHHERMDGSGYPQALSGEEICLEARILCVADVLEAMASHRPYRPALGIDTALGEIRGGRGKTYDERVADACLRLFEEQGYELPDTT